MFKTIISISQVVFALALIILTLLQDRGSGIGETFGGQGGFHSQRRGFEKIVFILTLVCLAAFAGLSLTAVLVK
ncbi:MAG: preprotein translocase subunit SecG [Candidatus Paceibacterota bacterium]|jgi:protein translocase SecG subunit